MTAWHNADPPRSRSSAAGREGAVSAAAVARRSRRGCRRFDELLGRPVSMRALALLRVLAGPGRAPAPAAVPRRRAGRADLPRRVLRALRRLVSGAAARGLRRAALARGGGRGRHVARPPHPRWRPRRRSRSSPTTCSCRPRTSTTTGPTSSSCSGCSPWRRAAGSCRWTRGSAAAAAGRRSTPRAPAWPLWLLRFECAAVYAASGTQQAPRSRLVRRHGDLAARGAGAGPARGLAAAGLGGLGPDRPRASTPGRPSSSSSPSCSSRPACGGAAPATRRSGSPSSSTSRIEASASVQVFSYLGDRRARDLGGAVHPGPGAAHRPGDGRQRRWRAAVRGLDWLARFRIEPGRPGRGWRSSTATAPRSTGRPPWRSC